MIRPGLLTASTNKADHLGMSTDRVACLSMIGAPFASVVLVFGLKHAVFPLRSEVGTRVGARPTQGLPERSGGLGRFSRVVGRALVAQSETKKRENEKSGGFLGWNGRME